MFSPYARPEPRMHHWRGESGEWYWFSVCRIDEIYDFDGIVYILARARSDGYFDPLYIGQSGEGDERLRPSRHEKMPAARALGLTDVHVHFVENRIRRFSIETDLRRRHATPLNQQPTPAPALGLGDMGGLFGYGGGIGGGLNALLSMNSPATPRSGLGAPPANALRGLGIGGGVNSPLDNGLDELMRGLSKRW
jgi:hypothetical protein